MTGQSIVVIFDRMSATLEPSSAIPETAPLNLSAPRDRGLFLRNLADFQTELFRVVAGFIPAVGRWKVRRELTGVVFRDARRVQDLRQRCKELGSNFAGTHASAAVPAAPLLTRVCQAPDPDSALYAVFTIIKPCLHELLKSYLQEELRIFDAPSTPVVEESMAELERQMAWAAPLFATKEGRAATWLGAIRQETAGLSLALSAKRSSAEAVKVGRKIGQLPVAVSVIPNGFNDRPDGTPLAEGADYAQREVYHAHNFLMEIQASDSCASLLFEAPDMPWEFYFDLARHMWDESRHCEFGEIKLKALGQDIRKMGVSHTAYVMRQTIDPLDRYAALTTQEADAFPGKHVGLQDAIAHGDNLSARAWSYDIADETQHVRYGHKWIPVMIKETGEPRSYAQLKRDAENWRRDVLGTAYAPTARSFDGAASKE